MVQLEAALGLRDRARVAECPAEPLDSNGSLESHAASDASTSTTGWRVPSSAGPIMSAATTSSVPSTVRSNQNAGGGAASLFIAALDSSMSSPTPIRVPGIAEVICATIRPRLTWRARAPRARMTAEARRASSTVAHVVKMALRNARATSMTVITPSICKSRFTTGSGMPDAKRPEFAAPENLFVTAEWKETTATRPVTVTAIFAVLRSARRGRRATSRNPNNIGTGSLRESLNTVASRQAADVGEGADRACARGANGGHERRGQRHDERDAKDFDRVRRG